jgi:hypothetical protein
MNLSGKRDEVQKIRRQPTGRQVCLTIPNHILAAIQRLRAPPVPE